MYILSQGLIKSRHIHTLQRRMEYIKRRMEVHEAAGVKPNGFQAAEFYALKAILEHTKKVEGEIK